MFTRSRSIVNEIPTIGQTQSFDHHGQVTGTYPFCTGLSGVVQAIADVEVPNWRRIQSAGGIVMNPLHVSKWERTYSDLHFQFGPYQEWDGAYNVQTGDWISACEGLAWSTVTGVVESVRHIEDAVLIDAYAKMNSAKVLSGESLSDIGKTVAMFRRPFRSSTELLRKIVKRRDWRMKRKSGILAKANADAWLEARYGWTPILLDTKSIVDDVTNKLSSATDGRRRQVVRASRKIQNNRTGSFSGVPLPGNTWLEVTGGINVEQNISVSAGVMYDLAGRTAFEAKAAYYGFRGRDLVPLIYEKIPYSFVLDWFVNVGDWLEASLPNPDVSVRAQWVTTVGHTNVRINARGSFQYDVSSNQRVTATPDFGSSFVQTTNIDRYVDREVPTTPEVKIGKISLLHLTDAAALVTTPILGMLRGLKH